MSHVYGDSTPFPYDVDYIDLSRLAVDCAVQLMSAQHAISTSLQRGEALRQERRAEIDRIHAMARTLAGSLEPFVKAGAPTTERFALRLLESIGGTANAEVAALEQQTADEASQVRNIVSRSGESAIRALEAFLLRHDLPGTERSLSWTSAGEQSYAASVTVDTPFGIQAVFGLAIAPEHLWSRPRRVVEFSPAGLEVHFPQPAGWLSKRVEMAPLKLDRLYLSAMTLDVSSVELRLRKNPSSGSGYRVSMTKLEADSIVLQPLGDDGVPDAEVPLALDAEDGAQMLAFCTRVVESAGDLPGLRRSLASAAFDGEALDETSWPAAVAERLIAQLAPVMNEIAKRSGAPGELVLRRDVGGGRREEVYVTKAELCEKILVLPPSRRAHFEPLGVYEPRRDAPTVPEAESPLAGPPSSDPEPLGGEASAALVEAGWLDVAVPNGPAE